MTFRPTESDPTDEALLRRYGRAGDAGAMESLVRRHGAALGAYLAGWARDAAEAEDLAQEAWLRVLRSPDSFRGGSFRAWLLRIARNLAVDRSRKRSPELWLDAPSAPESDAPPLVETLPDAASAPPDAALLAAEDRARLLAAVRTLPGPQRDVFLLRAAGVPFAEIAARASIPLNTALGRMHYAMKALRAALAPKGAFPP